MSILIKLFFRGLAAILPIALTGYLVYYAVVAVERLLASVIEGLFPSVGYQPGMGIFFSVVLVMVVGLLMYTFIARFAYRAITRLMQRIPVVKSVFGIVRDVVQLIGTSERQPFGKVVMVRLPGSKAELLGFVTRETFEDLPEGFARAGDVAVYLPMSYQLGGFTLVVPKEDVRQVEMTGEAALRFAVTAGVSPPEE